MEPDDSAAARLERIITTRPPRRAAEPEVPEPAPPPRWARPWGRRQALVVGVILALGLVLAGWAVLGARAVSLPTPSTVPSMVVPTPGGSAATPAPTASPSGAGTPIAVPSVVVHVLGAVKRPGVVTLQAGARVQDAIEAAGGLRPDAAPGELNLAAPVADGSQVVVGTRHDPRGEVRTGPGGSAAPASPGGTAPSAAGGGPLDLNVATLEQLDALPGVGPVTAQRILDWRAAHGRFERVEQLQEIDGIGPKTYARLAEQVRV